MWGRHQRINAHIMAQLAAGRLEAEVGASEEARMGSARARHDIFIFAVILRSKSRKRARAVARGSGAAHEKFLVPRQAVTRESV